MQPIEAWAVVVDDVICEAGMSDGMAVYRSKDEAENTCATRLERVVPVLIVPRAAVREAWAVLYANGKPAMHDDLIREPREDEIVCSSRDAADGFCEFEQGERVARVGIVELPDA